MRCGTGSVTGTGVQFVFTDVCDRGSDDLAPKLCAVTGEYDCLCPVTGCNVGVDCTRWQGGYQTCTSVGRSARAIQESVGMNIGYLGNYAVLRATQRCRDAIGETRLRCRSDDPGIQSVE